MSLKAAAAGGIVWSSLDRWGRQLIGFAVFAVLARLLDRQAFGLVALAGVYVGLVQVFVTQGLGTALVQRKDLRASHLDAVFWGSAGAAIVLAAATVLLRTPIARLLEDDAVAPVLAWLSGVLPLAALSVVPTAILTREMRFRSLAMRSLAGTLVSGAVGITAASLGFGVWSLVAQQITLAAVSAACLWWSVTWRPGLRADRAAVRDLSGFCAAVMLNDVLWFVSQRVDQGVIGAGLGVEILGAYAIAVRVVTFASEVMLEPAQAVAMPAFSSIQDDPERLGSAFVRSTTLVSAVALPAFLGLALVAPRFVPAAFGARWEPAVAPLQVLCAGGALRSLQTFVHPVFMAVGRVRLYTAMFALYAVATAAGSWIAAPHGVVAVAWAVTIAAALVGAANAAALSSIAHVRWREFAKPMAGVAAACGTMALAVLGVGEVLGARTDALPAAAAQIVAGVAVYVAALALVARGVWTEAVDALRLARQRGGDAPGGGAGR